jgi:hypothetical protein
MSSFDDDTNERRAIVRSADSADGAPDDIRRRARERLHTEGYEVGVRVLIELADDKRQKGSTRGAAAKSLVQSNSTVQLVSEEDLTEMSADQIRVLLAETERALEARMNHLKTIEHAPAERAAPESAQRAQPATDVFE